MPEETLSLRPGTMGWVNRFEPVARPARAHRHRELEFNLVTRGGGGYLIDGRRYELAPHTLLWLHPGQEHLLLEVSRDFEMWIAVFAREAVRWSCRSNWSADLRRSRPRGLFCKRLNRSRGEALARLTQRAAAVRDEPDRFNAALLDLLMSAWAEHAAALRVDASSDVHPAVERAVQRMRRGDDVGVEDIAAHAGLSPSHLSRLFKSNLGVSLVAFRQRQRLERFIELYAAGRRLNLTRAAFAAGFGSYPQFHRVFKQHLGISPAEYRRRMAPPKERA